MTNNYFNELSYQEKYAYLYGRSLYEVEMCKWLSNKTTEITKDLKEGKNAETLLDDFLTTLADKIQIEVWEGQIQKKQLMEAE